MGKPLLSRDHPCRVTLLSARAEAARDKLELLEHYESLGLIIRLFAKVSIFVAEIDFVILVIYSCSQVSSNEDNKMSLFNLSTSLGVSLFSSLPIKRTQKVRLLP